MIKIVTILKLGVQVGIFLISLYIIKILSIPPGYISGARSCFSTTSKKSLDISNNFEGIQNLPWNSNIKNVIVRESFRY